MIALIKLQIYTESVSSGWKQLDGSKFSGVGVFLAFLFQYKLLFFLNLTIKIMNRIIFFCFW
jgi:hypothetical protein